MTVVEINSGSISTKVWDRAGIELATPGSAADSLPTALQGPVGNNNQNVFDYWTIFCESYKPNTVKHVIFTVSKFGGCKRLTQRLN